MVNDTDKMYSDYAEGGLVSKNAMSDYFLASSGKMTEMEFVGKHKISTLNFENKFQEDNNVDIAGIESFSDINDKPKGIKMDYSKKPKTMYEGGEVDPVSGNDIPPGVRAENVRDDVPAMLSEGEYVVPADVLKYFGVSFFEKLRAKAKSGMSELEEGGRVGGEPTGMAEGGVVDEAPKSTFDPSKYSIGGGLGIGASGESKGQFGLGGSLGSSAYESRDYTGPNGETIKVLFVGGVAKGRIPEGYLPTGELPVAAPVVAPTAMDTDMDRNPPDEFEGMEGDKEGNGGFDPLGELDFTNAKSVESWASDRLSGGFDNKAASLAGGFLGPLGPGLGSLAAAGRDVAVVNAAAMAAYAADNTELGDSLKGMVDKRTEDSRLLGVVSESLATGNRIFRNHVKSKNKAKETVNNSTLTDFGVADADSSIDRSGFDSSQEEAVTSSARPQARPSRSTPSASKSSGSRSVAGGTSGTPDGEGGYTFDKGGLVSRPKKTTKKQPK